MRRILVPTVMLLATLTIAGCSASGASNESASSAGGGDLRAPESVAQGADASADFASEQSDVDRQIVTTGYATITVDEPADVATEVATLVDRAGGRVDSRTEYAPVDGDRGSAQLTLRIPATALTSTIESLKKLGDVQEISLSSDDVTTESQDLDARITALRSSVDRLTRLLATAKDTKVLIELETAISERQGNLESMEAQQRYLADQVSMSTIELSLVSTADAPVDSPDTFLSGLGTGWSSLVAFFSGLLVVIGVLLPWIVVVGVLAAIAALFLRRARTKRRKLAVSDQEA